MTLRARAAAGLLVGLALLSSGCFGRVKNDPDERGAASLGVRLVLEDFAQDARATGRLWLRLMPMGSGEAAEGVLEWKRDPGEEVTLEGRRYGGGAGLVVFDDLLPDRYRLASYRMAARFERPGEQPVLTLPTGRFDGLPEVQVAAGELVDLGDLRLSVTPDHRFRFEVRGRGADERLATVGRLREDLEGHRRVARAIPQERSPAPEPAVEAVGPGGFALGLSARAHGALADAASGTGTLAVEVRRQGGETMRRELAWTLGPRADGDGSQARVLEIGASDALVDGAAVLAVAAGSGRYELSLIALYGELDLGGVARPVAAEADTGGPIPFEVRAGELVDLGVLRLDLASRRTLGFSPEPPSGAVRAEAVVLREGEPRRLELRPVASPIRALADPTTGG